MLNGRTGGSGGNHILPNLDCTIQRGANKGVPSAINSTNSCTVPESTNESLVEAKKKKNRLKCKSIAVWYESPLPIVPVCKWNPKTSSPGRTTTTAFFCGETLKVPCAPNWLGLKVLCAPKWNDFEFPIIKTTKLLVETRSGTWAKRI